MKPTKEQAVIFQQLSLWSEPRPPGEQPALPAQPDQVWASLSLTQQQLLWRTLVTICHQLATAEVRPNQTKGVSDERT